MASTTETTRRTEIALVLARWLDDHGYTVEDMEHVAAYGREAVVRLTRVDRYTRSNGSFLDEDYSPSPETWAAAMTVLRDRQNHPNPFAGFPS